MTTQEIFDTVVNHLFTQGRPALGEFDNGNGAQNGCVYRNKEGLKCAVGCLINDVHYNPEFENCTLFYFVSNTDEAPVAGSNLLRDAIERSVTFKLTCEQLSLLDSLQRMHDFSDVANWSDRIKELASKSNLSTLKTPIQ